MVSQKTSKSVKIFSLEIFRLYSMIRQLGSCKRSSRSIAIDIPIINLMCSPSTLHCCFSHCCAFNLLWQLRIGCQCSVAHLKRISLCICQQSQQNQQKCSKRLSQRDQEYLPSQRLTRNYSPGQESKQIFSKSNVCPRTKIRVHDISECHPLVAMLQPFVNQVTNDL